MKFGSLSLRSIASRIVAVVVLGGAGTASAGILSQFTDGTWTLAGSDDVAIPSSGFVNPGYGGQAFDAEYLFYKQSGSVLTIGVQAGFNLTNLTNGYLHSDGKRYYSGDLALSFDNSPTTFEYAIDFGLNTLDYYNNNVGLASGNTDPAGLYLATAWNNQIAFTGSSPFAMDDGIFKTGLLQNISGSGTPASGPAGTSYYRIVSFDTTGLNLGNNLTAHWTMSCGNDVIGGRGEITKVPEPGTLSLLGLGLLGIVALRRRRTATPA